MDSHLFINDYPFSKQKDKVEWDLAPVAGFLNWLKTNVLKNRVFHTIKDKHVTMYALITLHLRLSSGELKPMQMKFKHLQFLLLAMLVQPALQAQRHYSIGKEFTDSLITQHGIYEISADQKYFRKRKTWTYDQNLRFDRSGREILWSSIDRTHKRPRMTSRTQMVYDMPTGWTSDYMHLSVGYFYHMTEQFNDNNQISSYMYFKRNGKVKLKVAVERPDSNTVIYQRYSKGFKYSGKTVNTFYGKKISKESTYNRKNKLIRTVDYNCNEEGKKVNPKHDTVKVCTTRSNLRNGDYIITTSGYFESGEPYRIVEHYDSFKRILEYKYYYGKEDFLSTFKKSEYNNGKLSFLYEYHGYRKSKYWSSSTLVFDESEKVISRTDSTKWTKEVKTEKFEYTYNGQGLISSRRGYTNGVLSSEAHFRYRFFREETARKPD